MSTAWLDAHNEAQEPDEAMTNDEYLAAGGTRCPYCRSNDISAGELSAEGREASQEVGCSRCGAVWFDVFALTGWAAAD